MAPRTVTRSCCVADLHDQPAIKKNSRSTRSRTSTPVALLPAALLVTASKKLPVKSARELFDLRGATEQITYASAGLGSINQISTELIALSAGVRFMHVPTRVARRRSTIRRRPCRHLCIESSAGAAASPKVAKPRPLRYKREANRASAGCTDSRGVGDIRLRSGSWWALPVG